MKFHAMRIVGCLLAFAVCSMRAPAATYDVRSQWQAENLPEPNAPPGTYSNAWLKLGAAPVIRFHYKATPYKLKIAVTQDDVTLEGVPSPNGDLPVIDSTGVTGFVGGWLRPSHRTMFAPMSGVFVGPPTGDPTFRYAGYRGPKNVSISRLEITGANNGVYVYWSQALSLTNCIIRDNGQGLFVSGNGQSYDLACTDVVFRGSGTVGSYRQHQVYAEALGVTWTRCHFLAPKVGMLGSQLKSRSGGEVIRDCVFTPAPGFLLDLCDPQESNYIHIDPAFKETLVENCTLTQDDTTPGRYVVHFGDDGTDRDTEPPTPLKVPAKSRPHLTFKGNTVALGPYAKAGRNVLFDLRRNETAVDVIGNTFNVGAGVNAFWLYKTGTLTPNGNTVNGTVSKSVRPLLGTITGG